MNRFLAVLLILTALAGPAPTWSANTDTDQLKRQVADVERAFAATMKDRDHAAFASFLSDEAVFFNGSTELRGREAVAAHWKEYYTEAVAPFSWEPELVSVLDSGNLALSTGPVRNAQGQRTATYMSIWRQEAPGVWRIIFDKGARYCE